MIHSSSHLLGSSFLCHPRDHVILDREPESPSTGMYTNVKVHFDDLSNYFVHTLFLQSMCVSDSLIHIDAYKCLVHVDDSSIFSSYAIFLHPCAFVSLSSTWMHKNVTMWMIRRTISSTTLFLPRCGFVILSSTWMPTNVTPCGWFVELFRPQCCFFIHMDLWSLIHMDA